jgi:8-oxo-dGTP pyrophosphatase MutT (NUDIX family)
LISGQGYDGWTVANIPATQFERRLRAVLEPLEPRRYTIEGTRDAAVLIPIVAEPEPTLLFTVRTEHLPSHKGQISFPGGSIDDEDASPIEAALREAEEEIGLGRDQVRVIGELDSVPTFVTGYVVAPVVAWLDRHPDLEANPQEVAEILEIPISHLTDANRVEPGYAHQGFELPTEAWLWENHVIWGATARILRNFLNHLAEAGLVEAPGETRSWTAWNLPAFDP